MALAKTAPTVSGGLFGVIDIFSFRWRSATAPAGKAPVEGGEKLRPEVEVGELGTGQLVGVAGVHATYPFVRLDDDIQLWCWHRIPDLPYLERDSEETDGVTAVCVQLLEGRTMFLAEGRGDQHRVRGPAPGGVSDDFAEMVMIRVSDHALDNNVLGGVGVVQRRSALNGPTATSAPSSSKSMSPAGMFNVQRFSSSEWYGTSILPDSGLPFFVLTMTTIPLDSSCSCGTGLCSPLGCVDVDARLLATGSGRRGGCGVHGNRSRRRRGLPRVFFPEEGKGMQGPVSAPALRQGQGGVGWLEIGLSRPRRSWFATWLGGGRAGRADRW